MRSRCEPLLQHNYTFSSWLVWWQLCRGIGNPIHFQLNHCCIRDQYRDPIGSKARGLSFWIVPLVRGGHSAIGERALGICWTAGRSLPHALPFGDGWCCFRGTQLLPPLCGILWAMQHPYMMGNCSLRQFLQPFHNTIATILLWRNHFDCICFYHDNRHSFDHGGSLKSCHSGFRMVGFSQPQTKGEWILWQAAYLTMQSKPSSINKQRCRDSPRKVPSTFWDFVC